MTRICVDDQVSEVSVTAEQKVADVLESLFANLPPNRIVARVTLDGLRFSQSLSGFETTFDQVKELQVRTADKGIWAATGVDIALSCAERVQKTLIRAAELFREEDKARANSFFIHCVDGLERFLESITITRCALALDFSKIQTTVGTLALTEQEMNQILEDVILLQSQQDFIGLADKVEYELIPNLATWTRSLGILRTTHYSALSEAA